ncbi:MAG: phospho-N-acetylmuramoyl-pentapeptide-transferase [Pseudanabaenaceae cyanobacterium bins.39]|nr:phospho-N-acetylmuramoyl-pentapeptide-transferase [Pseudanabaenaceae cyanobacterium bins.39]
MVDTGVRVRKAKYASGNSLALGLAISLIILTIAIDIFWQPSISNSLLLPFACGCLAVVAAGSGVVPVLRRLKAGQIVREDGPQGHLKKQGTPTMGGIFIVPTGILLGVIWSGFNEKVIACGLLTLSFAFIGWLDDWKILRRHSNKGLSPRAKLLLQAFFAVCFCGWLGFTQNWQAIANINLPMSLSLPLGLAFFPFALFVFMGSSNATNLTDGLDGLAGGTGAIALFGLAILLFPKNPELAIFCMCLGGSYLGFLWHNRHPARVFMGDTGSLALGGALASTAILGNLLWAFAIIGAIFIWESLSVIVQVSYYKATKDENGKGKRFFKMAPFHHHLELCGWHELQVVRMFYITGGVLVAIALLLSKF